MLGNSLQLLSMAREPTPAEIGAILKAYKPRGWKIVQSRRKHGIARYYRHDNSEDIIKTINIPVIKDMWTLAMFLHEVGHVHRGHFDQPEEPEHVHEWEAEVFATHSLSAWGFDQPAQHIAVGKRYVRSIMEREATEGITPDPRVVKWLGKAR
jgi:hypothetical protein